jgi:hypothetical protein
LKILICNFRQPEPTAGAWLLAVNIWDPQASTTSTLKYERKTYNYHRSLSGFKIYFQLLEIGKNNLLKDKQGSQGIFFSVFTFFT